MSQVRKRCFLKKDAKPFVHWSGAGVGLTLQGQSFLVLFFKKEPLP
jgi:hypothetical protein